MFPDTPFDINDRSLITYLKRTTNFRYFNQDTKKIIWSIDITDTDDDEKLFRANQDKFHKLWSLILIDALLKLKKHDSEEWKGPSSESFFHRGSLGINELDKLFDAFKGFEGMLYGASPERYRDHVIHSFKVWILGHAILKNHLSNKLSIFDIEKKEFEEYNIEEVEWECMWALTALCHDVGYPIASIGKINEKARNTFKEFGLMPIADLRYSFSQQMLPFHDTVIKLMSSKPVKQKLHYFKYEQNKFYLKFLKDFGALDNGVVSKLKPVKEQVHFFTHLQNKFYLKFLKSFDQLDHGIVSAMLISKALVYFLESDYSHDKTSPLNNRDARQFLIRREILRAVSSHTCLDIYHSDIKPAV